MKKRIAVLSGAGMSAESGLKTFRDAGGLWEGHDVTEVATPEGWQRNMDLVLEFYNQRRRQLQSVTPNAGHQALVALEEAYDVCIITQNVDDLHERAGSSHVIHLHGELLKARSTQFQELVYDWTQDIVRGDLCEQGAQLRPHIVWFGEAVPLMKDAVNELRNADIVIVVGTSMQVYPAASLVHYAPRDADVYYVDPRPQLNQELEARLELKIIRKSAGEGIPALVTALISELE